MANILPLLKGSGSAVQLLHSLIKEGIPAEELLGRVKESGFEIETHTAHLVINYINKAIIPATEVLEKLEFNAIPHLASIPLSLTKTLRNFAYLVKLTGESQLSTQLQDQYITISTNSLLTKEQAIDAAQSLLGNGSRYEGLTNATGAVDSISQNAAGLQETNTILPAPSQFTSGNPEQLKNTINANRDYLKIVASGPVTPIVFSLTGQINSEDIIGNLGQFISKYGQ